MRTISPSRAGLLPWLVRGLCLLFLPLTLVWTSPGTARAATITGPGTAATFNFDGVPGYAFECTVTLFYRVTSNAGPGATGYGQDLNTTGGDCETGPLREVHTVGMTATGITFGGADCEFEYAEDQANDAEQWDVTLGSWSMADAAHGCSVTEVCLIVDGTSLTGDRSDNNWLSCENVSMGTIPVPGATGTGNCIYGNITSLSVQWLAGVSKWQADATFAAGTPSTTTFKVYMYASVDADGSTYGAQNNVELTSAASSAQTAGAVMTQNVAAFAAVEVITPTGSQTMPNHINGPSYTNPPGGFRGYNNPDACQWWFGTKVWNDTGSTFDEPQDIMGGTPAPTEDPDPVNDPPAGSGGCDFSITDPASWLEGGMCAAVGFLQGIWEELIKITGKLGDLVTAVGDLGGTIATAITDALSDLFETVFVPSDEAVQEVTDGASEAWDSSAGSEWFDATGGLFEAGGGGAAPLAVRTLEGGGGTSSLIGLPTGGGCEGPTFSWDKFETAGLPEDFQPFAACDGTAADLAGWSHLICTALIGLFGGIKILEMLLQALGLTKQMGIMTSFDWKSPESGRF